MMKRLTLLKFAIISCIACSIVMAANSQLAASVKKPSKDKEPAWVKRTGARKFPSTKKKFSVNQYGAKPDAQTANTKATQAAIDACAGMKESRLQNFHFNNVNVPGNTAGGVDFGEGWKFDNVTIAGSDGKALKVSNADGVKL